MKRRSHSPLLQEEPRRSGAPISPSKSWRRPPFIAFSQGGVRWFFRMFYMLFFRVRVHGLKNYPATDKMLICSNHASDLDPMLVGSVCPRPINYIGKDALFRFKPLGWFLGWNDTISLDRGGKGIAGMKETFRRLKRGEAVLIFPEGTRSRDGKLQPLKSGFIALARRTKATLLPIGIVGTFEALPRNQNYLRCPNVHVTLGKPIPFHDYSDLPDEELESLVSDRIRELMGA